jgi:hypothetical protein
MKKWIQELFWWAILGLPVLLSLAFFLNDMIEGLYPLGIAICLTGFCWFRSKTEKGPVAQLPSNTMIRLRSGQGNYIGYYVNAEKKAIDGLGNVTYDKGGKYQAELRSGLSGLVFILSGMVVTIVGIKGVYLEQTELDKEQDADDGSVSAKTRVIEELSGYHNAIPLFIRRAFDYGGIPIKDKNLVNIGMEGTVEVTNLNDFTAKFDDEDVEANFSALQGTLESTLRPKIEGKSLKQVQQIRSEYHSTKKKKVTPKERAASPVLQAIHEANVATTKKYRYGIKISDLDIPILGPADKTYAKAERAEGLAIANAKAATVKFNNDRDKGLREAEVMKAKNAAALASGQPAMALFAEGMKGLRPGVTFAPGMPIMPFGIPSAAPEPATTEGQPTTDSTTN